LSAEQSPVNLGQFFKRSVPVQHGPTIDAPRFGVGVNLCRFNKPPADLETLAPPNANYFVGDARIETAVPSLLIYRGIPYAGDLPVFESITPKSDWQWLIEMPFLTPSLSRGARFGSRSPYRVGHKRRIAFLVCR
jgi:hypothetical protein